MAIREIVKIGDDVLRKKSRPVEKIDKRIIRLLDDMADTLRAAQGAGLAAPQVGVLRSIFIADPGDGKILEFINPVITAWSGEQTGQEGCLSIPGEQEEVTRPMYVSIEAVGRDGKPFAMELNGLMARCACHETDHLNGKLYIDYEDGNALPEE